MLPYVQAMLLARYLRGDLDEYPPFFLEIKIFGIKGCIIWVRCFEKCYAILKRYFKIMCFCIALYIKDITGVMWQ